jgi:hypothetical protein
MTETKSAFASKINWTAAATAAVSLAAALGLPVSDQLRDQVLMVAGVAGPLAVIVLRTWFTRKAVR